MESTQPDLLSLLTAQGFNPPEPWLTYARDHGVRHVPAEQLHACPDCDSLHRSDIGQYVYYSHLVRLVQCLDCGLAYTDTRFPRALTEQHFETTYKDEEYFLRRRAPIFRQLTHLIARIAPADARVLDVGGATGTLMAHVRERRPDVDITVNDVSSIACERARALGFKTVVGDFTALAKQAQRYDVMVLSDVLYYETALREFWRTLPDLVTARGSVVLRVPNKLMAIKRWQTLRTTLSPIKTQTTDHIALFNPEHLFAFPRSYLVTKLLDAGFRHVTVLPSAPLAATGIPGPLLKAFDQATWLLYRSLGGRVIASPAMIVVAQRRSPYGQPISAPPQLG